MHGLLRTNYQKWAHNPEARQMFIEMASQLGLDSRLFMQSLESSEIERAILQQEAVARDAGIESTPTFEINGRKLNPAPKTFEEFDNVIIDILKALTLDHFKWLQLEK
jgi:predicted DsbA family dithiol-disulfide isomerase